MKKGFMMEGNAFKVETLSTNKLAQEAKTLGQHERVAKTSGTDKISGDVNSNKYHSK